MARRASNPPYSAKCKTLTADPHGRDQRRDDLARRRWPRNGERRYFFSFFFENHQTDVYLDDVVASCGTDGAFTSSPPLPPYTDGRVPGHAVRSADNLIILDDKSRYPCRAAVADDAARRRGQCRDDLNAKAYNAAPDRPACSRNEARGDVV